MMPYNHFKLFLSIISCVMVDVWDELIAFSSSQSLYSFLKINATTL